jgi:1,4-alpha-glucan branching enzyme
MCRPVSEGGVGFDYRLQMAIADKWIEVHAALSTLVDLSVPAKPNKWWCSACMGSLLHSQHSCNGWSA